MFYEADFMRITRSLRLAGTMLPALVLSDLSMARSLGDGGRFELAQREEPGELGGTAERLVAALAAAGSPS